MLKKVGIVVNSIGYGGNERSAVNIAKALHDKCDITIITQEDKGNHYQYGGKVICLDTPCADSKSGKVITSLKRIGRLKKVINKLQLDSLLIILPTSNPINYMKYPCKKITSCRDCGDLIKNIDKYEKMLKKSDVMVCNSKYMTDYIGNYNLNLKSKAKCIYNILDLERIEKLKKEKPDQRFADFVGNGQAIISIGRFVNAKGWNNLLKAFSIVEKNNSSVKLILMGEGELESKIKSLIKKLHIEEKVMLWGFEENPFKYEYNSDVFVLPSFYEGFPNSLIEAMAVGVPVVATDCPSGPSEILQAKVGEKYVIGEYGVLVKSFKENGSTWDAIDINENHRTLAAAIEQVLKEKDRFKNISDKALMRADDFTEGKIAEKWEAIF